MRNVSREWVYAYLFELVFLLLELEMRLDVWVLHRELGNLYAVQIIHQARVDLTWELHNSQTSLIGG